jgi:hypothetical protein
MIILFVLLLAGFHWKNASNSRWLLVDEGVERNAMARNLIDSLLDQGFERRLLREVFPKVNDKSGKNNWDIISSLEQQRIKQAVVLSFSRLEDFSGLRKAISPSINWITFPATTNNFVADAIQQSPNSILVRYGHSNSDLTYFESKVAAGPLADSISIHKPSPVSVLAMVDVEYERDGLLIKMVLQTIANELPIAIKISESKVDNTKAISADWLIWFSKRSLPLLSDSTKILSLIPSSSQKLLVSNAPNHWVFTKRLTVEAALQQNLTVQLASLFVGEDELWKKIAFQDRRALPDSILFNAPETANALENAPLDGTMNKYLLLLFFLVFFIERIIAYRKNQ